MSAVNQPGPMDSAQPLDIGAGQKPRKSGKKSKISKAATEALSKHTSDSSQPLGTDQKKSHRSRSHKSKAASEPAQPLGAGQEPKGSHKSSKVSKAATKALPKLLTAVKEDRTFESGIEQETAPISTDSSQAVTTPKKLRVVNLPIKAHIEATMNPTPLRKREYPVYAGIAIHSEQAQDIIKAHQPKTYSEALKFLSCGHLSRDVAEKLMRDNGLSVGQAIIRTSNNTEYYILSRMGTDGKIQHFVFNEPSLDDFIRKLPAGTNTHIAVIVKEYTEDE